jgi:hypothetical protein
MSFSESLRKNADKIIQETNDKATASVVELFNKVVELSPTKPAANYAKGHFINNWFPAINGFDYSTTTTSYDGIGSYTRIAALRNAQMFLGKDCTVTLTNSLHYGHRVEYDGWPITEGQAWTGRVGPYAPVRNAITYMVSKA